MYDTRENYKYLFEPVPCMMRYCVHSPYITKHLTMSTNIYLRLFFFKQKLMRVNVNTKPNTYTVSRSSFQTSKCFKQRTL